MVSFDTNVALVTFLLVHISGKWTVRHAISARFY